MKQNRQRNGKQGLRSWAILRLKERRMRQILREAPIQYPPETLEKMANARKHRM